MMTRCVTVAVENKPGALANICNLLAKENVNIEAFNSEGNGELGFIRLVTNNPDKCTQTLKKGGFAVTTTETFEVSLANRPGELARLCKQLAERNVNIESAFGTAPSTGEGRIVFRVNNPEAARTILGATTMATAR